MANNNPLTVPSTEPTAMLSNESLAPKADSSFVKDFSQLSVNQFNRLKKSIFGDMSYRPKNTFPLQYKEKIFKYLKAKYLTTLTQLQDEKAKKFTKYDPNFGTKPNRNLKQMKDTILKLKTHIEAADDSLQQLEISLKSIKANFYNEVAYEFDTQRKCSGAWGLLFGALVCSTLYRKGSYIRKAALFVTSGVVFTQISYYSNIDKYFDTIYTIFEQDAVQFVKQEERERIRRDQSKIKGSSVVQD